MLVCILQHQNGTKGELHRNHSFEWEIKLDNGKSMKGSNLIDHVIKDVNSGVLKVIDGTLPTINRAEENNG